MPKGYYPLSDETKSEMVRLYREGMPVRQIARVLGVANSTVHRNLDKLDAKEPDITKRQASAHRLSEDDRVKIVELYRAGVKMNDIAEQVGCSKPTIYIHVKHAGLLGSRDVSEEAISEAIQKYIEGKLTVTQILRDTGLAKATFYRKLKKYAEEQEA